MDANQIKQQFQGYASWNDPAAIMADFKATGGQGKGGPAQQSLGGNTQSSGGGNFDINASAQNMLNLQNQAIQPAVDSLNAQKQPLQDRYDAILQSLKGQQQQDVTRTQTSLSQEYGKRGIPLSSGDFQQALNSSILPINQNYASIGAQTGLQEQNALLGIAQQVAGLQSGAANSAVPNALNLLGQQNQYGLASQNYALQQQQLQNQLAQFGVSSQIAQQNANTSAAGVGVQSQLAQYQDPTYLSKIVQNILGNNKTTPTTPSSGFTFLGY